MKKLFKLMIGAAVFYLAGFLTIYAVALVCGAPLNYGSWHDNAKVAMGLVGAPVFGIIWGAALDEVTKD